MKLPPTLVAESVAREPAPPLRRFGLWISLLAFYATMTTARRLIEICNKFNIDVPGDLAVVGVNNDDLICRGVRPSLTSVSLPLEQIGERAVAMMSRLVSEKVPSPSGHRMIERLPPLGVAVRGSSDRRTFRHAGLDAALAYIRDHYHDPIDVAGVVRHTLISRRTLELLFRKHLNCTPAEEIRRVRLEHAAKMLRNSQDSVGRIALKCGFSDQRNFSTTFKAAFGMTPSDSRNM